MFQPILSFGQHWMTLIAPDARGEHLLWPGQMEAFLAAETGYQAGDGVTQVLRPGCYAGTAIPKALIVLYTATPGIFSALYCHPRPI